MSSPNENPQKQKESPPQARPQALKIASLAVLIALTAVFTYLIRIPVAPTRGYINFGDVAVFFTAISFGPFSALIAGGIGTALADIIGGYAQWAPFTFFAHGLQGMAAALIVGAEKPRVFRLIIAFIAGTLIMGGIYFLTGGFMVGFPAAALEIPGNIIQNLAGILIGGPLALAVRRAYPPITRYRW